MLAVLAWDYLRQANPGGDADFDPDYGSNEARQALHEAVQKINPPAPWNERVVLERPARALLDAGVGADLIVVGSRGLGGFKGLLLGSVSERVLEQARRPVAVVREHGAAAGAIVVGIDASETAPRVLRWAADEARTRQALLHVIHAWQVPSLALSESGQIASLFEGDARGVLHIAMQDPALSGVEVQGHPVCTGAAQALLGRADDASIVVVGSSGLGPFGRAILGLTSRQVAPHARCPIVVVPVED